MLDQVLACMCVYGLITFINDWMNWERWQWIKIKSVDIFKRLNKDKDKNKDEIGETK